MRSARNLLHRLVARSARRGDSGPALSLARAHEAVLRTAAQQRAAQRRIAAAGARRVDLEHAIREQRRLLEQAGAQIAEAITAAEQAGADARVARENPQPYEQTVAGLKAQLAVVGGATTELDHNGARALETVGAVRYLLDETGQVLDTALRAQVSLLAQLERLQRRRRIAEATLRARKRDQGGDA